jgi:hypothetical protein
MEEERNNKVVRTTLTYSLGDMFHEHGLACARVSFDPEESQTSLCPGLVPCIFEKPFTGVYRGMDVIEPILLLQEGK